MAYERELKTLAAFGRPSWRATVALRAQESTADSWAIVVALIAFWTITIVGAASPSTASLIKLGFAPAAFAVGFWLWRVSPAAYLSFIWQLFFFASLIRRLVDYQVGWDATNPVVIAPYAAVLWCGVTLLNPRRLFAGSFVLLATGLLWAVTIGVIENGMSAAIFAAGEWAAGPLVAGYLVTIREQTDRLEKSLFITAGVSALVMGLYGIAQECWPAPWDQNWISSAGMTAAIGVDAGSLRVFSTMNSPWPFAMTVMGLAVFLLGMRGSRRLRVASLVVGIAALVASQTRAAWGGLVVGWILLVVAARKGRARLLTVAATLSVIAVVAIAAMPSSSTLFSRLATLTTLVSDQSLGIRLKFYQSFLLDALSHPVGAGLGKTGVAARLSDDSSMLNFDSGVMNVPFVLGWAGALAYLIGLSELLLTIGRRWRNLSPAGMAAGAACAGLLAQMLFLNSLIAASGVIFWTFLAVCLREVSTDQPAAAISRLKSLAGK